MAFISGSRLLVITLWILIWLDGGSKVDCSEEVEVLDLSLAQIGVSSGALAIAFTKRQKPLNAEEVMVLRQITKFSSVFLILLYDKVYEERANEVLIESPEDPAGLMVFENDGNPSVLKQILTRSADPPLLLALCSPQSLLDIFVMIRHHRLESHQAHWLIVLQESESSAIVTQNLTQHLLEGVKVTLLSRGKGGNLNVSSAEVDTEGRMRFVDKGQINQNSVSKLYNLIISTEKKDPYSNFLGRKLTVAVNDLWPYFGLGKQLPDGTVTPNEGIDVSLLKTLSKSLNFTYELVRPKDRKWGNVQPDGTVTGFIGMVARWEANFAITTIAITDKRATVVDYSFPYWREPLCLFSRTPKQKSRALAILTPFTLQVWICLIISTISMGPILWLYSKASPGNHGKASADLQQFTFAAFRNMMIQGNRLLIESWALRVLFFFWYSFCLIVSSIYSGSLTAYLAIPAYETPYDSLEDLPRAVEASYTLGVMEDSSHEYVFKKAEEGIYKKTWDLFNHDDRSQSFVNSPKTGIHWVLEKDFVYIGPKTITESIALKLGIKKFHIGRSLFFTANIAIPCPPGAPYLNVFSQMVMKMKEGGLVMKWKDDEIRKVPQIYTGGDSSRTSAISLTHLQAAFIIVIIGYLLAFATLVLEKFWCRNCCFSTLPGQK